MEDLVNPREVTKDFFLLYDSLFPCVTCLLVLWCIYLSLMHSPHGIGRFSSHSFVVSRLERFLP